MKKQVFAEVGVFNNPDKPIYGTCYASLWFDPHHFTTLAIRKCNVADKKQWWSIAESCQSFMKRNKLPRPEKAHVEILIKLSGWPYRNLERLSITKKDQWEELRQRILKSHIEDEIKRRKIPKERFYNH